MGFIPGLEGWFNIHKSVEVINHINRMKGKNHLIILIDAKIASTTSNMIKTQKKLGVEGMYFNVIKGIYDRLVAYIILNGEKQKVFL